MSDHYDKQGNKLTLMQWGKLFEDRSYQQMIQTTVGDYRVSTIWLGLDHSFGSGPPLIFETMVFGDGAWSQYQDRYTIEEHALAGHDEIVEMVRRSNQLIKTPPKPRRKK